MCGIVKLSKDLKNGSRVLAEFRTIVREHCDDKDTYFLVGWVPETLEELGFEPLSHVVPADGYDSRMLWWKGDGSALPHEV